MHYTNKCELNWMSHCIVGYCIMLSLRVCWKFHRGLITSVPVHYKCITYIYIYIYNKIIFTHIHTHTYIYIYRYIYIYIYIQLYSHIYTHTHTYTYTYIYIYIYTHTHTHIYIYIYTHTHTHIYIYIYIYIYITDMFTVPFRRWTYEYDLTIQLNGSLHWLPYWRCYISAAFEGALRVFHYWPVWLSIAMKRFRHFYCSILKLWIHEFDRCDNTVVLVLLSCTFSDIFTVKFLRYGPINLADMTIQ